MLKNHLRQRISRLVSKFNTDSLFQNSIYLIASTGVLSVCGFIFWIIVARSYHPEQIGIATALISVTVLLSNFSLLGYNTALVRYLPASHSRNKLISTSVNITALASAVIAVGYLLGIKHFAPQFSHLTANPYYSLLFVILIIFVSVNTLTDSIFIAYRQSKYNFIVNSFLGLTKLIVPVFLVSLGAYGIFVAFSSSILVAIVLSFFFVTKKFSFAYRPAISRGAAKMMAKFSIGNYSSTFLLSFPILVLPTIIVNEIGSEEAAYFFLASTISNLLYIIPQATTQSLLAEGSHNESEIFDFVRGAAKLIASLLVPAVAIIMLFGQYFLLIFGSNYSSRSLAVLQIMSLTSLFLAANLIAGTILKIRHRILQLNIISLGYLAITLGAIVVLLPRGTKGISYALLIGQLFMCAEYLAVYLLGSVRRKFS